MSNSANAGVSLQLGAWSNATVPSQGCLQVPALKWQKSKLDAAAESIDSSIVYFVQGEKELAALI